MQSQSSNRENLPHATVATIVEKDGKYLMVKELINEQEVFNQPAGHIEAGESITEAALRETLEETGWTVELKAISGISVSHAPSGITYIRITIIAEPIDYDANLTLDDGILEAPWMSYEEVLASEAQHRSPIVLKVIEDYRKGIRFPLDMLFEQR